MACQSIVQWAAAPCSALLSAFGGYPRVRASLAVDILRRQPYMTSAPIAGRILSENRFQQMRPKTRPFMVEIRRAKKHPTQRPAAEYKAEEAPLPAWPVVPHDVPTGTSESSSRRAHRVAVRAFALPEWDVLRSQPQLRPVPESWPISPEDKPQKPRVLPDLRVKAETKEAVTDTARRLSGRSRKPAKKPARKEVMLLPDHQPDVPAGDRSEQPTSTLRSGAPGETVSQEGSGAPEVGTGVGTPKHAQAALHLSRRYKSSRRRLPRGERWKERRLPRVCWDRPNRAG